MNISFGLLQTFREVMRSGSVSEAARTLRRTQPAHLAPSGTGQGLCLKAAALGARVEAAHQQWGGQVHWQLVAAQEQ